MPRLTKRSGCSSGSSTTWRGARSGGGPVEVRLGSRSWRQPAASAPRRRGRSRPRASPARLAWRPAAPHLLQALDLLVAAAHIGVGDVGAVLDLGGTCRGAHTGVHMEVGQGCGAGRQGSTGKAGEVGMVGMACRAEMPASAAARDAAPKLGSLPLCRRTRRAPGPSLHRRTCIRLTALSRRVGSGSWMRRRCWSTPTRIPSSTSVGASLSPRPTMYCGGRRRGVGGGSRSPQRGVRDVAATADHGGAGGGGGGRGPPSWRPSLLTHPAVAVDVHHKARLLLPPHSPGRGGRCPPQSAAAPRRRCPAWCRA